MNPLWLNVAGGASVAVSLGLTLLAAQAWRRTGTGKHALLTLAFGVFLFNSLLSTWWIFYREDLDVLPLIQWGGGTIAMLILYVATVKR